MNRKPQHEDASLENDAVWKLLEASPRAAASPRFASATVRMARLGGMPQPWWKRLVAPAPLAGLAAACAAALIAVISLPRNQPSAPATTAIEPTAFTEIQELAETEILLSAVDHLDQFSDGELVALLGF
jgi:ferric-dicitrate binding protein FerR (iron transport regulator)